MAKLKVVKLNYETTDGLWKASVLSFNGQEAQEFTKRVVGKKFKGVRQVSEEAQVDAITDEAKRFLAPHVTQQSPTRSICPWCEKEFDNLHGLKIHISKTHFGKQTEE